MEWCKHDQYKMQFIPMKFILYRLNFNLTYVSFEMLDAVFGTAVSHLPVVSPSEDISTNTCTLLISL